MEVLYINTAPIQCHIVKYIYTYSIFIFKEQYRGILLYGHCIHCMVMVVQHRNDQCPKVTIINESFVYYVLSHMYVSAIIEKMCE